MHVVLRCFSLTRTRESPPAKPPRGRRAASESISAPHIASQPPLRLPLLRPPPRGGSLHLEMPPPISAALPRQNCADAAGRRAACLAAGLQRLHADVGERASGVHPGGPVRSLGDAKPRHLPEDLHQRQRRHLHPGRPGESSSHKFSPTSPHLSCGPSRPTSAPRTWCGAHLCPCRPPGAEQPSAWLTARTPLLLFCAPTHRWGALATDGLHTAP